MNNKRISIVIPSFNQGLYLEECILSILSQDYNNVEIIIIDGGSTDNSTEIIKKYASHITYWLSEKDNGQSDAINKGLERCSGEIVTWLGSDDMYLPGALLKVSESFSSLPSETGVIYGTSELFKDAGTIRLETALADGSIERILAGMAFPQPSSFFRRSVLKEAGLLNESLHYGMDYDLFSRLRMFCEFEFVDYCFSKYRVHPSSKTIASTDKFIGDWILVFNSICEGLGLDGALKKLEDIGLRVNGQTGIKNFFSKHQGRFKIKDDRLMYNFLFNVIRFDYESCNFKRARTVANVLHKDYKEFLSGDPMIRIIANRARFVPPVLLNIGRRLSRKIRYK